MQDSLAAATPLRGRVALVTGGARGIGREIAELLAQQGATVAVNYRGNKAGAESVVARIRAGGGEAESFCASVQLPEEAERLVEALCREFGDSDILVNCAGLVGPSLPVLHTDDLELPRLMAVHAYAPH